MSDDIIVGIVLLKQKILWIDGQSMKTTQDDVAEVSGMGAESSVKTSVLTEQITTAQGLQAKIETLTSGTGHEEARSG